MRKYVINSQHGFMPKRSTTSYLAVYSQIINKNLKAKKQVEAICSDMRAMLDKVDEKILFKNLQRLGIVGNAFTMGWIIFN